MFGTPRKYYATHRWLGALVAAQLFLWSLGGFIFATHSIDHVRGMDGAADVPLTLDVGRARLSPSEAAIRSGIDSPESILLRPLLDSVVYEIQGPERSALVDATTGEVLSPLSRETAEAVARADRKQTVTVASSALLTTSPPTEYRSGPLPAWRVILADEDDTHVYVDAHTGRVSARRNNAWRRFDFFWMLHTMDYGSRDNFNNPLLIGFASLSLLSVLSGILLWALRVRRVFRRKRAATE